MSVPITKAHASLNPGTTINVNVNENAVNVDATDTKTSGGKLMGANTMRKAGSSLGRAIADEIGVSVKNQGITITRW
jgi:phage terminase large subunit-like protein